MKCQGRERYIFCGLRLFVVVISSTSAHHILWVNSDDCFHLHVTGCHMLLYRSEYSYIPVTYCKVKCVHTIHAKKEVTFYSRIILYYIVGKIKICCPSSNILNNNLLCPKSVKNSPCMYVLFTI
jgi:hypothetical protein